VRESTCPETSRSYIVNHFMMDVATDDKPTIYEYGSAGTKFDGYAYEIFQNTEEIVCTYKRKTPWTVEGGKEADGCLRF
jgi:hypothetical protein